MRAILRPLQLIASLTAGFLLLAPLGWLFDSMNGPVFHTWGLVHGSFILAWPVLSVACFASIEFAAYFWAERRASRWRREMR